MNSTPHELVLLRHGKAENQYHGSDFDRQLTETGYDRTRNIAKYLSSQQLVPDLIVSSSAKRAIATANIVGDVFAIDSNIIDARADLYNADWHDVFTIIQQLPETAMRVVLVGHNPAFEMLVEQLIAKPAEGIHLSPSSMASLAVNDQWLDIAIGQCKLISIMHAQELV